MRLLSVSSIDKVRLQALRLVSISSDVVISLGRYTQTGTLSGGALQQCKSAQQSPTARINGQDRDERTERVVTRNGQRMFGRHVKEGMSEGIFKGPRKCDDKWILKEAEVDAGGDEGRLHRGDEGLVLVRRFTSG